jgi:hypothetical protein
MNDLRELTDAELDIVGGGAIPRPTQCGGGELKLAEEIIVDILRILEPNKAPQPAQFWPTPGVC